MITTQCAVLLFLLAAYQNCMLLVSADPQCQNGDRGKTGVSDEQRDQILKLHNTLRNEVASGIIGKFPKASNMKEMVWDMGLAAAAQAHADECRQEHFAPPSNSKYKSYGQNLYTGWQSGDWATANWTAAVYAWFNEYKEYSPNAVSNYQGGAGHFTQVIWAESEAVGCGYTEYKENRDQFKPYPYAEQYTCNYGPQGNVITLPIYQSGEPCSTCTCSSTYGSLCKAN